MTWGVKLPCHAHVKLFYSNQQQTQTTPLSLSLSHLIQLSIKSGLNLNRLISVHEYLGYTMSDEDRVDIDIDGEGMMGDSDVRNTFFL